MSTRAETRAAAAPKRRGWPWIACAGVLLLIMIGNCGPPSAQTPLAAPPASPEPTGPVVTVARIVDGDTVDVTGATEGPVQVLGIDAAEPDRPGCGAEESAEFAAETLLGRTVALVTDPAQSAIDQRGRLLAHLRLSDGSDYSVLAAAAGMATFYVADGDLSLGPEIEAAQADASASSLGLWGPPCNGVLDAPAADVPDPSAPADGRTASPAPTVDAGRADPAPSETKPSREAPSDGGPVTPGAYCSTSGATGVSKSGKPYLCRGEAGDRTRWRPAG